MDYEKRQKILEKCDRKADKYDVMANLAYIQTHDNNDSLIYHMQSIVKIICLKAESTRDYDEISSRLAYEVASLLKVYTKGD